MAIKAWSGGAYQNLYRPTFWNGEYYEQYARATIWDGSAYRTIWERPASYYDGFERADGSPGADWYRRAYGAAVVLPVISGGSLRAAPTQTNNQNNQCGGVYLPQTISDDMVVSATVTRASNGLTGGLLIGCDSTISTGVAVSFTSATAHRGIWSIVGSTWVRRADVALSCAVSDYIAVQRLGTVYSVLKDGNQVASWNDSTGIVPRGAAYRRGGYHGHSDVNVIGNGNYGMTIGDISIYDYYQLGV
ncbi:conserved hypothetical protein [Rhodococcus phage E3]|uniref:virion structural protein n=1 Tax=Rhodococcus phage E3 TaxID=1007869 RepID=UPI0002C69E71|nr:virion structural protein [Rhodococcus phage E3]AEQ21003.1 conserved hypothetical protein [Rhodococcus phage E3]